MKRREFIKAGAATATVAGAAGVGGAVGSACGGLFEGDTLDVGRIPLPQMDDYLRKVDIGLNRISDWNITDEIGETGEDLSRENELAKKALRSLYLVGMFGDLPDAGQAHPGMQARVERALPEMDEAVFGMIDYLQGVSDEDADATRELLREKSDPGMEFAEWMDSKAWSVDMSTSRRLKTRSMLAQAVTRLRNQSPRTVFEEYIGKVEKVAAQAGTPGEIERQLIARMGEHAFWERQQRLAMYAAAWEDDGTTASSSVSSTSPIPRDDGGIEDGPGDAGTPASEGDAGAVGADVSDALAALSSSGVSVPIATDHARPSSEPPVPGYERPVSAPPKPQRYSASPRKRKLLVAGGWCLGIAVLAGGLGAGLFAIGDLGTMIGGMVLWTAAGILLLVGLVIVIVAGIKYRSGRG